MNNKFHSLFNANITRGDNGWMNSIAGTALGGLIVIMNWATIWDTCEFFIFDRRQQMQRKKLLNKIIDSEIRVVPFRQDSKP